MKDTPRCMVEGCDGRAPFGFSWGGAAVHTCLAHRGEGDRWLNEAKGLKERKQGELL